MRRPRRNPGVITLATTYHREEVGYPVAEISASLDRQHAGQLVLTRMAVDDLFDGRRYRGQDTPPCAPGLARIQRAYAEEHERSPIGVLVVTNVRVETWAKNKGVGVALYAEAAKIARERYHSAIVADQCIGGQTSAEAKRIWESARFRRDVDVFGDGNVGFWSHSPTAQRNPAPKAERINIAAHIKGAPPLWGTAKTINGLRVIEVTSELYVTPDLEVEAMRNYQSRGDGSSGWIVSNQRTRDYSDPISTKAEALRAMVDWPRGRK